MQEDASFGVHADGTGEDAGFDIAACGLHFLGCEGVGDAHNFLFDDRAFVEVGACEMGCGADDFYAALVCLVVGFCAFETGQEGVVDIDNSSFVILGKAIGEDLHVAGKDNEFRACFFDERGEGFFLLGFIVFCDWQVMEGKSPVFGQWAACFVIGDDACDFDIEMVCTPTV